jgi:hypothetical protein
VKKENIEARKMKSEIKPMNWESFIDNLTSGEIIPVIGNDLSLVKDKDDNPVPLRQYIAGELTRRLDIPYTGQSIGELAADHPNANVMLTTHSIYNKIEEDRFFFDPIKKLAEITDIKFYISTSLDDLLEKNLRQSRNLKKDELKVINYSLQQYSDTPTDEEEEPPVTVFNLLGSLENITESAFTEEEVLEHFFSLSNKQNRHPMADYFMERVKNKILLFIGCDFPDWFMRFIIRILTNQRYKLRIFSDYIVSEGAEKSPGLVKFLEQFNKNIVLIEGEQAGNIRAFIDEMHEKWSEFLENRPIQYDGTVFLSYHHKDRPHVDRFKKLLRAKGIRNVWFDIDDLHAGEHKDLIEEEIKKCNVFVPMISDSCLENPECYTQKVEWKAVEFRLQADKYYGKMSFHVVPCIVDKIARNDERIPEYFRAFSTWDLDQDNEKMAEEIIKLLDPL